jgi:hypothetical protein
MTSRDERTSVVVRKQHLGEPARHSSPTPVLELVKDQPERALVGTEARPGGERLTIPSAACAGNLPGTERHAAPARRCPVPRQGVPARATEWSPGGLSQQAPTGRTGRREDDGQDRLDEPAGDVDRG